MEVGDTVEIKQAVGKGKWSWVVGKKIRTGLVTAVDDHCLSVRCDDNGEHIRDVREHFRVPI